MDDYHWGVFSQGSKRPKSSHKPCNQTLILYLAYKKNWDFDCLATAIILTFWTPLWVPLVTNLSLICFPGSNVCPLNNTDIPTFSEDLISLLRHLRISVHHSLIRNSYSLGLIIRMYLCSLSFEAHEWCLESRFDYSFSILSSPVQNIWLCWLWFRNILLVITPLRVFFSAQWG